MCFDELIHRRAVCGPTGAVPQPQKRNAWEYRGGGTSSAPCCILTIKYVESHLRKQQSIRRELTVKDFGSDESLESGGILCVFPTFQTARLGQKIHCSAEGEGFAVSAKNHLSCRQAMPGSSRPSRNSREAPPPVEMWVILSAKPSCSQAAAESPPPTMVVALLSARA